VNNPGMSDWKHLEDREIHRDGVLRLHRERMRNPRGGEIDWTVVDLQDGAVVLPVADDGSVWLIRQYRPAVRAEVWELPAGRVEPGEDPESAARRELEEEAGLRARQVESLGPVWPLDGIARHRIHHFVARGLEAVPPRHEEFEDISVHRIEAARFREMIRSGEFDDGVALALIARWLLRGDPS
jgi:ADP-ribose diphosphatase